MHESSVYEPSMVSMHSKGGEGRARFGEFAFQFHLSLYSAQRRGASAWRVITIWNFMPFSASATQRHDRVRARHGSAPQQPVHLTRMLTRRVPSCHAVHAETYGVAVTPPSCSRCMSTSCNLERASCNLERSPPPLPSVMVTPSNPHAVHVRQASTHGAGSARVPWV